MIITVEVNVILRKLK